MFTNCLKVIRINHKTVKLLGEFVYENLPPDNAILFRLWEMGGLNRHHKITIPEGFRTDYASTGIARFLVPKIGKYYWRQAILHDYVLTERMGYWFCQNIFLRAMLEEWIAEEKKNVGYRKRRLRPGTILLFLWSVFLATFYLVRIFAIYLTVTVMQIYLYHRRQIFDRLKQ